MSNLVSYENDLIRKQDIIDALHKEWDEVLVFDESGLVIADCCEDVIDTLPVIKISSGEISETKKKIVIENYYKSDITKETNLKEAFIRGFELGLEKAPQKVIEREANVVIEKYKNKSLIELGVIFGDEKFFCGNCKYELDINCDYYCPKCGTKIIWRPKER